MFKQDLNKKLYTAQLREDWDRQVRYRDEQRVRVNLMNLRTILKKFILKYITLRVFYLIDN